MGNNGDSQCATRAWRTSGCEIRPRSFRFTSVATQTVRLGNRRCRSFGVK